MFVHRERDQVVTALCCVSNTDLWVGSASGVRSLAALNPNNAAEDDAPSLPAPPLTATHTHAPLD